MAFIDGLDRSHLIVAAFAFALGYLMAILRRDRNPRENSRMPTVASAPTGPSNEPGNPGQPQRAAPRPAPRNWLAILFLAFWLVGWTIGIVLIALKVLADAGSSDMPRVFMVVWLAAAVVAWVMAARAIGKLLRSEPLRRGWR